MSVLKSLVGVVEVELTSADVVRHALVQEIINAYERAERKPEVKKVSERKTYQRKK